MTRNKNSDILRKKEHNMSIKNEPNIKNPLIVGIREQLEHRALWMYFLCDEAKKKGLDPREYTPDAIRRC